MKNIIDIIRYAFSGDRIQAAFSEFMESFNFFDDDTMACCMCCCCQDGCC